MHLAFQLHVHGKQIDFVQEWKFWNDFCWLMDHMNHQFITNFIKCAVFMNDGPIYYFPWWN